MTDFIGQQLGSYRIEALIAQRATGQRFRARHVRLDRPAALTRFDPTLVARPGVRPRLLAALRDAAALRDPHLVMIDDVGEADDTLFVAGELVTGGSLRDLLLPERLKSLSSADRLDLVAQAADGLAAIHRAGLIHGALKPESLLLARREAPFSLKVAHLGIAAILPEEALAAPAYLSPEQARGQALDARTDLYSLGVILYELLVGVPPFNVTTLDIAIEKHVRAAPVPPRRVRPSIPAEAEAIVLRCLAKRPEDRFPDAASLAAALREVAGASAPPPPPPSPRPSAPISATPAPLIQVLGSQGTLLRTADLAAGGLTIGRAPERDLYLDDPQIGPEHLRLTWDGQRILITDLGSASGTFLGGARLPSGVAIPWDGRVPLRVGPFTLQTPPMGEAAPVDDGLLSGLLSMAPKITEPLAPPPPAPAADMRIELRLDQAHLTLNPGSTTMVNVRLLNLGRDPAEVTLSIEGVPGNWLRESQTSLRLDPGSEASASLIVAVPRNAEALAGDYPVIFRARPRGPVGGETTARGLWTVTAFADSDLRISPARAEGREAVAYQVLLRNDGNAATAYLLSFEDEDGALGYVLEHDELTLEPGQAAQIGLQVEAAGRFAGSPQLRTFTIRAESGAGRPLRAEADYVHLALLPGWVPLTALAGLLLILAFLILPALLGGGNGGGIGSAVTATSVLPSLPTAIPPTVTPTAVPGAPLVLDFRVEPPIINQGATVLLTWNVQDATRVFVTPFGEVAPQGQAQYIPPENTAFQLTAIGPGGETTRIIQVAVVPPTPFPTLVPPTLVPTVAPPTDLPTVAPPTPLPTLIPTAVPPTAVPPTAVPPTAVPPTAVPPTPEPATAVPPIIILPTTTPDPGSGFAIIDLAEQARNAAWSTNTGRVSFGRPLLFADRGGWADVSNATLENGSAYQGLLLMVPPTYQPRTADEPPPFIEGKYNLPTLGVGQILVGSIGFGQAVNSPPVSVTITLNGNLIFTGEKSPDGQLLPIFADLSSFGNQGGELVLRVSAPAGPVPQGIYWVRPRVDVPR
ncbi:MAG: protein kinase domain-containing protein [Oscillochloridaceae bacterium umkhey_bin13]